MKEMPKVDRQREFETNDRDYRLSSKGFVRSRQSHAGRSPEETLSITAAISCVLGRVSVVFNIVSSWSAD